jgi:hypothetical protein
VADRDLTAREFEEQLPFYLNGTLSEEEKQLMDKHLESHADAPQALAFSRQLRDAIVSQTDTADPMADFDAFKSKLDSRHTVKQLILNLDDADNPYEQPVVSAPLAMPSVWRRETIEEGRIAAHRLNNSHPESRKTVSANSLLPDTGRPRANMWITLGILLIVVIGIVAAAGYGLFGLFR